MGASEVLRRSANMHSGYQLTCIRPSMFSHGNIKELRFKKLQRMPNKITAFLQREKIKAAYKSTCFRDPEDNYYLVVTHDGTVFHLDY